MLRDPWPLSSYRNQGVIKFLILAQGIECPSEDMVIDLRGRFPNNPFRLVSSFPVGPICESGCSGRKTALGQYLSRNSRKFRRLGMIYRQKSDRLVKKEVHDTPEDWHEQWDM